MSYYLTPIPGTKFFLNMPRRETPEEIEAHERRYNETTERIRTMATNLAIEAAFLASTPDPVDWDAEDYVYPLVSNLLCDDKWKAPDKKGLTSMRAKADTAAINAWHAAKADNKTTAEIKEAAKAAAIKALDLLYLTPA